MSALLVADLHLTSNARDAYRWRLFPWLKEAIAKHGVTSLIILGDLTEAKDYHSARLVNQIVDALSDLKREGMLIWLLRGNHDGTDPACPYFRFLRQLPFCRYIDAPYMGPLEGRKTLFLPHTKEPEAWDHALLQDAEVIFMHQTVSGAQSETGISLEGMSAQALAAARRAEIWSGDVHVPQKIGGVQYVGAPYPVRFGDKFKPRAVLLEKGMRQAKDLTTPHFARHSFVLAADADLDELKVQPGDQAKFRIRMTRAQFVGWQQAKARIVQFCEKVGVDLCGLEVERVDEQPKIRARGGKPQQARTPQQELVAWCERQKIEPALAESGQALLLSALK